MKKLLATLIAFQSLYVSGQQSNGDKLEEIASKLIMDVKNNKQNFLFSHLDKSCYMAGTTLWFRVYLASLNTHSIGTGTKTVYAGLYTPQGNVISRIILNAGDLQMNGGIPVPPDLPEGYYFFRASTGNSEIFPVSEFSQPVYIVNNRGRGSSASVKSLAADQQPSDSSFIRFFPEGGTLVSGVENKVAVYALGKKGIPLPVSGTVQDHLGNTITKFTTSAAGLGKFIFNPSRVRRYSVTVEIPGQASRVYQLPSTSDSAFQLVLVKDDPDNLRFRVNLGDAVYAKKATSFLLGISKDSLVFAGIGEGMYEVDVSKKQIPAGVADFYLYDDNMKQVSHRKVWIEPKNLQVNITADKERYGPRSKAQLKISITDEMNNPVQAILSVAVTDDNAVQYAKSGYTAGGFSISERLKHGLYCNTQMPEINSPANMELLLMTDQIKPLNESSLNPSFEEYKAEAGLFIRGMIKEKDRALPNESISIFPYPSANMVMNAVTDDKGYFEIKDLDFYDSTVFALQPADVKKNISDVHVSLEPPDFPPYKIDHAACSDLLNEEAIQQFKKAVADTFLTGSSRTLLAEIVLRSVKGKTSGRKESKNKFTRVITREQLQKQGLSTTANAVMMVPGVVMMNGKLTIRGGIPALSPDLAGSSQEPIVIIDGVQASPGGSVVNFLNSIPPEQIEEIEVLTGPEGAQYGSRAGNGVILIKTGLPQFRSQKSDNTIFLQPQGYHRPPEFYIPDYTNDQVRYAAFKDNRSTIYWNGDVFAGNEPVKIDFYTADNATTYTVTVTGMTDKGNIIYKTIKINRN